MAGGIKKYKPGVDRRVHVALAASLWSLIGGYLFWRGIMLGIIFSFLWPVWVGLIAGTIKSVFILDHVAKSGLERIMHFADNTCIGAVYSWKTWLLVLGMMIFGICLRRIELASAPRSALYAAIGWALIFSSRHAWKAWFNWKPESEK